MFQPIQDSKDDQITHNATRMQKLTDIENAVQQQQQSSDVYTTAAHGSNVTCKLCNCPFSDAVVLEQHLREIHKTFACIVCKKSFNSISGYHTHKIEIHNEVADSAGLRYICRICGKSFSRRSRLIEHEKRHSDLRLFQCLYCERSYKHKHNMAFHMFNAHGHKK